MQKNIKGSLSIAMPIYNVDQYLGLCLDSLCKALLPIEHKEVICVNDGSTDKSLEIIKEHKRKYNFIKIIDQENGGYGRAVNVGLDEAVGEFVTIVESDDAILPNIYEKLLNKLERNPDIDFVKTPYHAWINEEIAYTVEMLDPPINATSIVEYSYPMVFPSSIWSAVYRRNYLNNNNIRVIETPGANYQDTYFNSLVYLCGGKMLYHPEGYYLYRRDREESSVNSKVKTNELFNVHSSLSEALKSRDLFSGEIKALFYAASLRQIVWFFGRVAPHYHKKAFKLAHGQFTPVFNDSTLYEQVSQQLSENEKLQLEKLKSNSMNFFNSFFGVSTPLSFVQKIGVSLFGFIIMPFSTSKKLEKLKNQPRTFFKDSKSSFTLKVGFFLGLVE